MTTQLSRGMKSLPILAGLFLFVTACQKSVSTSKSNTPTTKAVNIYLTDDQSLVFDQVMIDIQKLEIKLEDSSEVEHEMENESESDNNDRLGHTSGGWKPVDIHTGVYDILKFRNGIDTLFGSSSFPSTHSLRKVRLTLGTNNSVVYNGNAFPVLIKRNDNFIVIKLNEITEGSDDHSDTNFWLDFDAGRSILMHGSEFEMKPQVKAFRKDKTGSVEGRVLPADANAVVYAIMGTDTTSAKPEREGEFKIIGLKPGSYSVVFHATANNYQDKTIGNVVVGNKEDAHLGSITLQK